MRTSALLPTLALLPALGLLAAAAAPVERVASGDPPAPWRVAPAAGPAAPARVAPAAARGALERCYGVARAGADDCQAVGRRCAGRATRDGQGDAWIWLPAGLCARLVGGSPNPLP